MFPAQEKNSKKLLKSSDLRDLSNSELVLLLSSSL
jgi:hypothetical protein